MLIAFSCSMTVSAIREPVVEFFTNVYEKLLEMVFDEEDIATAPNTIETVYSLGTIPDGYVIDHFIIDDVATNIAWKNENGERLVL